MSHLTKDNYELSSNFKNIAILARDIKSRQLYKETNREANKLKFFPSFLARVTFAVLNPKPAFIV